MVAASRACGFDNELGAIWFSFLAECGDGPEERDRLHEYYFSRAVANIASFEDAALRRVHRTLSSIVACRHAKTVRRGGESLHLMNCVIRLVSSAYLVPEEKERTLRAVSRRLFFLPACVVEGLRPWLARWKKEDFEFPVTGVLLRHTVGVKTALRTMSYEVSRSSVPLATPFMPAPVLHLNVSRLTVTGQIRVEKAERGSIVTQFVCLRSMLRSMVDESVWPIVSRGLCYMPAYRETSTAEYEQWVFHVHGPYKEHREECFGSCRYCRSLQPLSLFCLAQLVCLRNCFLERRARALGGGFGGRRRGGREPGTAGASR